MFHPWAKELCIPQNEPYAEKNGIHPRNESPLSSRLAP